MKRIAIISLVVLTLVSGPAQAICWVCVLTHRPGDEGMWTKYQCSSWYVYQYEGGPAFDSCQENPDPYPMENGHPRPGFHGCGVGHFCTEYVPSGMLPQMEDTIRQLLGTDGAARFAIRADRIAGKIADPQQRLAKLAALYSQRIHDEAPWLRADQTLVIPTIAGSFARPMQAYDDRAEGK